MDKDRAESIRPVKQRPNIEDFALVATDFDGTLLGENRKVSQRTRAILARLKEFDLEFVVVTGRPPRYSDSIPKQTGISATLICANGAMAYEPSTGESTQFATLDLQDAQNLLTEIRQAHPTAGFCVEMGDDFIAERRWLELASRPLDSDVSDVIPLLNDSVHKLLVNVPDLSADQTLEVIEPVLQGRANIMHAGLNFVELMPPGVDKAFGIKRLCEERKISLQQVLAFGDMPNDDAMLEAAGWGVAVANAHPKTLQTADEITASNLDDGVAQVLEQMLGVS
ncbi:MAG TPA: haloacid dehalogenase [Acidimicrobiaceae bacterium]|nr:haloacid dehalogenase [Acidimicrobiaceae bacterium]